jgi:hypothetical protein
MSDTSPRDQAALRWETGRYVIIPTSDIDTQVRENLNFLIDDFARAIAQPLTPSRLP